MIRLLTYNVKFLPDIARVGAVWEGGPNGMRDGHRADAVAARLLAQSPRWDVVCLQEVFDEDQRARLRNGLAVKVGGRPAYRHFVAKADDGDFAHEDSGLFVASRHAIKQRRFDEFKDAALPDSLSDKGVLLTELDTASRLGGVRLVVFSTHLQAGADHGVTRESQAKQLYRFMQRTLGRIRDPENYAVVVCGDLNIVGEHVDTDGSVILPTAEYGTLRSVFRGARDLYREVCGPTPHGATWDPALNHRMIRGAKTKERLDYVFALDAIPCEDPAEPPRTFRSLVARKVQVETFPHPHIGSLSDHFGLSVALDVA